MIKNSLTKVILLTTLTLFFTLMSISPAQAMTVNFSWQGNQEYSATGSFTYHAPNTATIISEKGKGETQYIENLTVSFFDKFHQPIATYNNVINGVATAEYFVFNFNPNTQEIVDFIDIGGEFPQDIYLKGIVNIDLSLIQINDSGSEVTVDRNSGAIATTPQLPWAVEGIRNLNAF